MVDTIDSKSIALMRGGSNPLQGTCAIAWRMSYFSGRRGTWHVLNELAKLL